MKHMKRMKKKSLLLVAGIVLMLTIAIGGTVAYIVTGTDPVVNTFTPGDVPIDIDEKTDGGVKSDVKITNSGTVPAYIRAKIIVTWKDAQGNVSAIKPVKDTDYEMIIGGNWDIGTDGFYYYKEPVAPGASTAGSLLTCKALYPENPEYTLSVEILATAIQSTPASAARNAWPGMPGSVK